MTQKDLFLHTSEIYNEYQRRIMAAVLRRPSADGKVHVQIRRKA